MKEIHQVCQNCGHYELYKMITSGRAYGYSGDIPCLRCCEYLTPNSEYTAQYLGKSDIPLAEAK